MSVVGHDWRDPAGWAPAKAGIGIVRDGNELRIARGVKSGRMECAVCTIQEWNGGGECRQRFDRDVKSGARVAAGLQMHRLLLRRLESPLSDASKSSEIWGALLDAAIPFSLESCVVVFLPPRIRPEGGLQCLAAAAREQDIQEALEEWAGLGIDPGLLLPEPLMLPRTAGCPVWMGATRGVFAAWDGDCFLGAAASVKREQREKALSRFQQAWKEIQPDLTWVSMGPEGDSNQPEVLESALCKACFETSPAHANLRAGPLAAESLQQIHRKRRLLLKGSVAVLLLLLLLWPLSVRFQLAGARAQLRGQIAAAFEDLTGAPVTAPGQEVLLAQRFLEGDGMEENRERVRRLSAPSVSEAFARISRLVADHDLVLTRIQLEEETFELNVLGEEAQTRSLAEALGMERGWTVRYAPETNGTWRISGDTRP